MWKLFFRIERIKAVRIVIDNSIATPFHIIIIDDTVLSILQTYSRFQENSLISFNNHISSNTLHSGNITLDRELSEIFRKMIQQFLPIIQREVLVHKWTNVEYLVEEYAGDVFMGDGDNDSVRLNAPPAHQRYNAEIQLLCSVENLQDRRTRGEKAASIAYQDDTCRLPPNPCSVWTLYKVRGRKSFSKLLDGLRTIS